MERTSEKKGISIWSNIKTLIGLNIIDVALTAYGLKEGMTELNPVMGQSIIRIIIIKTLVTLAIYKYREKKTLVTSLNIGMALIVIINSLTIFINSML